MKSLLVDNLRHIQDHGLAVEFTEPKLVALITHLRSKQGVTELKAGKSALKITTLGNVTKTEAFWSHGSYYVAALHYYEPSSGLKFTLKRESNGDAYATLDSVIFGTALPANGIWRINFGVQADKLREYLAKFAWTIMGSNGMRAQAISEKFVRFEAAEKMAKTNYESAQSYYKNFEIGSTPENFRASHEKLRARLSQSLKDCEQVVHNVEAQKVEKITPENVANLWGYGVRSAYEYLQPKTFYFPQMGEAFSHPIQSANYTVKIDSEGVVILSSGIRCEFTSDDVLRWLRGETPAPHSSRYGILEKREVSTPSGEPLNLLKCGCHWIDARSISLEFAALLTPTHIVTRAAGKAKAVFPSPEFDQRLGEAFANKLVELALRRVTYLREFAEARQKLTEQEKNAPAYLTNLAEKIETARAALVKAQADSARAREISFLGLNGEYAQALARLFLSSQSFHPSI